MTAATCELGSRILSATCRVGNEWMHVHAVKSIAIVMSRAASCSICR